MIGPTTLTASDAMRAERLRVTVAGSFLVLMASVLGVLGGVLTVGGHGFAIVLLASLFVPILFWKVPVSPIVLFVLGATCIARFPDPSTDDLLARIPLWRSLAQDYGISGVILFPIEMLLGLALVVWLARGVSQRRVNLRASQLGVGISLVLALAVVAELLGLAKGGVFNISLWEFRPFVYLAVTYLLASQLVTERRELDAVLWGMVIGTGIMGLLGTERVITLANVYPKPEAILEHDESFFFSCFIILTLCLWLFRKRGRLRWAATALLPFVVTADLGNNRRAAWVILPAALIALGVVLYVRTPTRRKLIAWIMGVLLVVCGAYVSVFRNSTSLVAEPAHAVWSQFQPDPRDASSNLYRVLENQNLAIDIKAAVFTGTGFGVPVAHPIPLYDASSFDPLINFIPHNNVLYVWLRMGTLGMIIFWWMIGAAVVACCRLARHPDRSLGLFGMVGLAAVMAWLIQGYLDVGLVSFRIITLVGCWLGAVAAAHRLAAAEATEPLGVAADENVPLKLVPLEPGTAQPAAAASTSLASP